MKNNRPVLIVALVLAIAAIAMIILQKTGSIRRELRDFAVKDTGLVDKLFMADKTGRNVTLKRISPNKWTVNDKFTARKEGIDLVLEALASMDVISPVAKAAYNHVIKDLSSGGVKVEVYKRGDLAKTFYVGGETQDQTGTYMLLDKSSMPFIMGIPGFRGYLTPRFFVFEQEWRDKRAFTFDNPSNIAKIEVTYNENPDQSFSIENNNQKFILSAKGPAYQAVAFSPEKVKLYVSNYMSVGLEAFINNETRIKDSVRSVIPFAVIGVTAVNGQKQVLKMVYMPNNAGMKDDKGNNLKYNPERLYGLWNDQDLVTLQFNTMDRLLKVPAEFTANSKTAEKH